MTRITEKWPFLANWRLFVLIVFPIILLPLLFLDAQNEINEEDGEVIMASKKFKCAYVLILMAGYWIVEAVPLAVTSFLPVILLPIFEVQNTGTVSQNYLKETNLMFLGGLIVSLAVEYSDLHRRIALRVLTLIGCSPARIVLGVMLTTMFLSMWMLNSAAAAMMIPVVHAVLNELNKKTDSPPETSKGLPLIPMQGNYMSNPAAASSTDIQNHNVSQKDVELNGTAFGIDSLSAQTEAHRLKRQKQMMLLAVCFASDVGGSGVVTGTTPNMVTFQLLKDQDVSQQGKYSDITFASWMAYAVPPMFINTLMIWFYLTSTFLGPPDWLRFGKSRREHKAKQEEKKMTEKRVQKMMDAEYQKLGPMSFHQMVVIALYFLVIMLWLFRDPRFVEGWGALFPSVKIGDSTAALFVTFLMFVVPRDPSFLKCRAPKLLGGCLDWKYVQRKVPWDIVILMGSGFAISDASDKSGLSSWIGDQLDGLGSLSNEGILIIVMILTSSITEVLSNGACANVVIPILISLSRRLGLHPLYLTLPAAISCSFAFMLPVGAPTNGIVYAASNGDVTILDMVKAGTFIKILCTFFHFLIHISYGNLLFNFNDYSYPNTTAVA